MPLPAPNLDEKTFAEILNEAIKRIPVYSKSWTDHNPSDFGITLLELFSWLVENQRYTLNRVDDPNYFRFLNLLGADLKTSRADRLLAQFSFNSTQKKLKIPKTTKLISKTNDEIHFETDDDLNLFHIVEQNSKIFLRKNLSEGLTNIANEFPLPSSILILGSNPKRGVSAYIGMDIDFDSESSQNVSIFFQLDDEINQTYNLGSHGTEKKLECSKISLKWQYLKKNEPEEWEDLSVASPTNSDIINLSATGFLKMTIPKNSTKLLFPEADSVLPRFWIRVTVENGTFIDSPKIKNIFFNSVFATQGEITSQMHIVKNDLPSLEVFLKEKPVIGPLIVSGKKEDDGKIPSWSEVLDFNSSNPNDLHYILNRKKGTLTFGDGVNGKIPNSGDTLSIQYRHGQVSEDKIPSFSTFSSILPNQIGKDITLTATNPIPSSGGKLEQNLEQAFDEIREDLRIPYKAVNSHDYSYIAKNTPGLRIARAEASSNWDSNTVTVVVIPYSPIPNPIPSEEFLSTVCCHLNKHRILTTKLIVEKPSYVQIRISGSVSIDPQSNENDVKETIEKALSEIISPIPKNANKKGWPMGRSIFRSEILQIFEEVKGVKCVDSLYMAGFKQGKPITQDKNGNLLLGKLDFPYYFSTNSITAQISDPSCKRETFGNQSDLDEGIKNEV